jgi:amino acid transporter
MNTTQRFGIVIGCLIAGLAGLAYVGVNFAEKPVSWMPIAFLIVLLLLTVCITWALHPLFLKIQSIGKRYATEGISLIVGVLIIAYIAYVIFVNMWMLFGGSL